jgi:hypothetical protein
MTKKATWSGYRGDGKPVIPCVPECSIEKSNTKGHMVKAPVDYKVRTKRLSSSPRKQLRRIRNDLFFDFPVETSVWANDYYLQFEHRHNRTLVQKAFDTGDLDLMLTYKDNWGRGNLKAVHRTVLVLREMGREKVHGVITETHIRVVEQISKTLGGYVPVGFSGGIYKSVTISDTYIPEGTHEIALIALSGEAEGDAVLSIINDRKIIDPQEIGKLVKEMLVESSAVASGFL